MFDWANVSSLIAICAAFLAVGGFYWRLIYELKHFREDVIDIKLDLKQLNKVIMDLALQNQRLDNQGTQLTRMAAEIEDLRHGKGFVVAN